jgi:hypothetical protein
MRVTTDQARLVDRVGGEAADVRDLAADLIECREKGDALAAENEALRAALNSIGPGLAEVALAGARDCALSAPSQAHESLRATLDADLAMMGRWKIAPPSSPPPGALQAAREEGARLGIEAAQDAADALPLPDDVPEFRLGFIAGKQAAVDAIGTLSPAAVAKVTK